MSSADVSARIERELREPVPAAVVARAKAAFARRGAPGSLATLASTSWGEPRRLAFSHPGVQVHVTVVAHGDARVVVAHAEPTQPLEMERAEGPLTALVAVADGLPFRA